MAGYGNFQTDNVKYSKDRSDIYNPQFQSPVQVKNGDFISDNIEKWAELTSFWRWYP